VDSTQFFHLELRSSLARENLEQEEEAFFQPFLQVASHQLQANYLQDDIKKAIVAKIL
jgi:hypothetical protein